MKYRHTAIEARQKMISTFRRLAARGAALATSIVLSSAWSGVAFAQGGEVQRSDPWPRPGEVYAVAHRACWAAAPENSTGAVQRCRKLGVEAIEIDVQLTRDGEVVVFHDRMLDRMTNGSGLLSDFTLDELRQLRLKERDGIGSELTGYPFLTHYQIPTLSELFEAAGEDLLINLEVKANPRWSFEETFLAAVEIARSTGVESRIFWKIPAPRRGGGAADTPADEFFRSLPTDDLTMLAPIVWQSERPFHIQMADYAAHDIRMFELVASDEAYWPLGEDGRITGADEVIYMGVAVLPKWGGRYTDEISLQDPEAGWGAMIDLGFRMIMTDRAEQLAEYLRKRAAE